MFREYWLDRVYRDLESVPNIELSDSEDEVSKDDHVSRIFQTSVANANMPQDGESQADVKHPEILDQICSSAEKPSQSRSLVFGTSDSLCNGERTFLRKCRREILNELKYRHAQNHM